MWTVVVRQATEFNPDLDRHSLVQKNPNLYVAMCSTDGREFFRTPHVSNSVTPQWNFEHKVDPFAAQVKMEVKVYDYHRMHSNKYLGCGIVTFADVKPAEAFSLPVLGPSGKRICTLELVMSPVVLPNAMALSTHKILNVSRQELGDIVEHARFTREECMAVLLAHQLPHVIGFLDFHTMFPELGQGISYLWFRYIDPKERRALPTRDFIFHLSILVKGTVEEVRHLMVSWLFPGGVRTSLKLCRDVDRVLSCVKPKYITEAEASAAMERVAARFGEDIDVHRSEFEEFASTDAVLSTTLGLDAWGKEVLEKAQKIQVEADAESHVLNELQDIAKENSDGFNVLGWCSWCFFFTAHGETGSGNITGIDRAQYKCTNCLNITKYCRIVGCKAMARSLMPTCAQHNVTYGTGTGIPQWGAFPTSFSSQNGACSWCGKECINTPLNPSECPPQKHLYTCTNCSNRTCRCLKCQVNFAPAFDDLDIHRRCLRCETYSPILESTSNPYEASSPSRDRVHCVPYVCGADFFDALADALWAAEETIFISNWCFVPQTYLRRYPLRDRLDTILTAKAAQGVKVYVLLYHNIRKILNLKNDEAEAYLLSLHPNIKCIRHPAVAERLQRSTVAWSHHQKFYVIDQDIAFIGGIDVTTGRWDTKEYPLVDAKAECWIGPDYFNRQQFPLPATLGAPQQDVPELDRANHWRMPWRDVQVGVNGELARDVADMFVKRWEHHRASIDLVMPKLVAKTGAPSRAVVVFNQTVASVDKGQLILSMGEWSGSAKVTGRSVEMSIYGAYLKAIKEAEHYIFIENQYVISNTGGGGIENRVAEALLNRLRKAIATKSVFRVIIIAPIYDENWSNSDHLIMMWQTRSLTHGASSILQTLKREFPEDDVSQYFSIFALRQWALHTNGSHITNLVFVHSKIMVVDDRVTIVASANFNDRSFLGDRDSEAGIVTIPSQENMVPGKMNGQEYMVSAYARNLRDQLWRSALGNDDTIDLTDPICDGTFNDILRAIGDSNGAIYEKVFSEVPRNSYHTWADMRAAIAKQPKPQHVAELKNIKGVLRTVPLEYLRDQMLAPGRGSLEHYVSAATFQ